MSKKLLLDAQKLQVTLMRLSHQLLEDHGHFKHSVLLGLQPRGPLLMQRLLQYIHQFSGITVKSGELDVTFHRDDFRRKDSPIMASPNKVNFSLEDQHVILVDDVLFTGRTVRAGMDAMLAYGRPAKVQLLTLIDRRYSRHLPIEPDYVGMEVDTIASDRVEVQWKEKDSKEGVWLVRENVKA